MKIFYAQSNNNKEESLLSQSIIDKSPTEQDIEQWIKSSDSKIGTDIAVASFLIKQWHIVGIPTETVYGLAANALDEKAVVKIFEAKSRPFFDPLIVHVANTDMAKEYVTHFSEKALILANHFWPGPLTLLLPKNEKISDLVTSWNTLVGLRVPAHSLTLSLIQYCGLPLAAPSANKFGYISPTKAQHVADQLHDKVPYILDGGPCEVGIESTIVGFDENDLPVIYRKGGIPVESIEALLGKVIVKENSSSNPQAPGMLKKHYSPKIPFFLGDIDTMLLEHKGKNIGVISFCKSYANIPSERMMILSHSHNLQEAAQSLFAAMRHLDSLALDVILAELMPNEDLWRAMNDKLKRAAAV